jgi:hypothetical protein
VRRAIKKRLRRATIAFNYGHYVEGSFTSWRSSSAKAAEASLAAQNYVSPVDVLVGIGWLDPGAVKRWRQGQVDYLERVVRTNLSRISEAMKLFRSWATAKGLIPSETSDVLCRADAVAADTALQQERSPDDRTTVPHPLAFGRAFS